MAEFQEVCKQWRRMCDHYWDDIEGCTLRCPLVCNGACNGVRDPEAGNYEWERVEVEVMAWAAEHPEPQYPMWGEWFVEHGDLVDGWQNATNAAWMANTALNIFMKPIPADIAEKLGIEPKENV